MASVWKNLAHALPIADLACLLFDVHGPLSILVWTGSLFPFLEVNLFNLSNKPLLGYCWNDPPPCSYCPPCCHTCCAYCSSSLERYIARCNSSSLSEYMLWTTFPSVATSSLNNECRYCALLFSAVLSKSRWKYSRTSGGTLQQCFTLDPCAIKCCLNYVALPPLFVHLQ
jgi:hypothetical protein